MVGLTRPKKLAAPAILAGALLLLALSPVGAGRPRDADEEIWWALEQLGAQPLGACLEGQFLVPAPDGWETAVRVLPASLLPAARPAAAAGKGEKRLFWQEEGGATLNLAWHPLRGPDNWQTAWRATIGQTPVSPPAQGEWGVVVARLHQPGRGRPAALAAVATPWPGEGYFYRIYVGRLAGTGTGPHLERKARRLMALLGARARESVSQGDWVNLCGYGARLGPDRRTLAGTAVNVQVVLRARAGENGTLVYVGLPLLPCPY